MFALEVDYLLGRSFAGHFRSRSEAEWPPHPGRLFSALAAAYFENGASRREEEALTWLEQQRPPAIFAEAPAELVRPVTAFVPTNYPGDTVPVLRRKQPREFPAVAPSDTRVYFIWRDTDAPPEVGEALDDLASRAGYLGRACSLVRMRVTQDAPKPNYEPAADGQALRVPAAGRLEELAAFYAADIQPSAGALQPYRRVGVDAAADAVKSRFGQMLVFRKHSGDALPLEATLTLTAAVREALMSNGSEGGTIPDVINGHNGEHCAVVALPFVGREHADGHLLGFAVVLPREISAQERRLVLRACGKLKQVAIRGVGEWSVEPETDTPLAWNLRAPAWTRPAQRWSTVTPILLDRFPKKKGPTVEDIIAAACRRIGLPTPMNVEHGPYSRLTGVPPVPQFRLHRKADERPRWGVHATLEFDSSVQGPVLLGAGRYFGMGLLRPDQHKGEKSDDGV